MAPLALLLFVLLAWPWHSAAQCPGVTTQLTPFATEQLTVSSTALPLTPAVYRPTGVTPSLAMVSVEGGAIRYQVNGTPTATLGHPVSGAPSQTLTICGIDSIAAFRAIRIATDATLTVTYYRPRTP